MLTGCICSLSTTDTAWNPCCRSPGHDRLILTLKNGTHWTTWVCAKFDHRNARVIDVGGKTDSFGKNSRMYARLAWFSCIRKTKEVPLSQKYSGVLAWLWERTQGSMFVAWSRSRIYPLVCGQTSHRCSTAHVWLWERTWRSIEKWCWTVKNFILIQSSGFPQGIR